jgi:hypothetical protein
MFALWSLNRLMKIWNAFHYDAEISELVYSIFILVFRKKYLFTFSKLLLLNNVFMSVIKLNEIIVKMITKNEIKSCENEQLIKYII